MDAVISRQRGRSIGSRLKFPLRHNLRLGGKNKDSPQDKKGEAGEPPRVVSYTKGGNFRVD